MPFALDEHGIALHRRRSSRQHIHKTVRRHLRPCIQSGDLERRRRQIRQRYELVAHRARLHFPRPAHRQRHAGAVVVAMREPVRHLPAVVARVNDHRVVQLATRFEQRNRLTECLLHQLHLRQVVGDLLANLRHVRQGLRHAHLRRINATRLARAFLPLVQRGVRRSEPEEERLLLFPLLQKAREVLKLRSDRIQIATEVLVVARAPAFTRVTDMPAGFRQVIPEHAELAREFAPQARRILKLMRRASGDDARARRRTRRHRAERIREAHALAAHAVKHRRAHRLVTVRRRMLVGPVVADQQQDVRWCGLNLDSRQCQKEKQSDHAFQTPLWRRTLSAPPGSDSRPADVPAHAHPIPGPVPAHAAVLCRRIRRECSPACHDAARSSARRVRRTVVP